jgi:hypothetical protein
VADFSTGTMGIFAPALTNPQFGSSDLDKATYLAVTLRVFLSRYVSDTQQSTNLVQYSSSICTAHLR